MLGQRWWLAWQRALPRQACSLLVLGRQPPDPGLAGAASQDALRHNLAPVDAASAVPLARWDLEDQAAVLGTNPARRAASARVAAPMHGLNAPRPLTNAGSVSRFSVFLDEVDLFDATAFATSEAEAALMDPQQRLLLEAAAETLLQVRWCHLRAPLGKQVNQVPLPGRPEASRWLRMWQAPAYLSASPPPSMASWHRRAGRMYVSPWSALHLCAPLAWEPSAQQPAGPLCALPQKHLRSFAPYSATGHLTSSVAAGRISYSFGMRGPSLPVDTVCSSSLVRHVTMPAAMHSTRVWQPAASRFLPARPVCSLHLAFSALRLGHCPAAVNAAANLLLTPNTTAMTQKAGMLAPDGRCKTLSPAADGYARADACSAMLLLPPTASAAQGGQLVQLAAVVGTAVNQDGRSSSLTAPNGPSQQAVVRVALAAGGLAAAQVAALQMHGTGGPAALCAFPFAIWLPGAPEACLAQAMVSCTALRRHFSGRPH